MDQAENRPKVLQSEGLGRGICIGNKGVKDLLNGHSEDSYTLIKLDEVSEKN